MSKKEGPNYRYTLDIADSVPDHSNKASCGFPVQIEVMFTLYCGLLSMQQHYV